MNKQRAEVSPAGESAHSDTGLDVERLRAAIEICAGQYVEDTEAGWRLYAEDIAHEYDRIGEPLTETPLPSEHDRRSEGQRRRWAAHRLAALEANPQEHVHEWIDARNEVVTSGEVCRCGAVRPAAGNPQETER